MRQLTKPVKKVVRILLSVIMLAGLFTIVPFSVGAEGGTHTLTVDLFEPSLLNDHYENISLETNIDGSVVQGASHTVQSGTTVSVTASLIDNSYRFHVTGMTMTYVEDGETKTIDAELERLDAYRNVKGEFTIPSADARISFTVEEIYSVQVTNSSDGTIAANCIRARKGDTVNVTVNPTNPSKPYYKLFATYEWEDLTRQLEINNNSSFIMPAGSDVTVYAEFFDAVATYIERSWDGEKVVDTERIRTPNEGYIKMSSVANGSTLQDGKWYYVNSNVTFSERIHTDGEVNIILGDVTINKPETVFDLPEGVTFEGATISLKSETSLSIYLKSSTKLTFSCDGKTVETVSSGGYQIARIRGIPAKELQNSFTLTITAGGSSGSVTYSPMNYCYNVLNGDSEDEKLINVSKALILYARAADEYFD